MKLTVLLLLSSTSVAFAGTNSSIEDALKNVPPGATDLVPRTNSTQEESVIINDDRLANDAAEFSAFQAHPNTDKFNRTLSDRPAVVVPPRDTPWEIVMADAATLAVPKGWRSFDGIRPTMVIYRQGDGIGVPIADETGSPLQVGLTLERFPTSEKSIDIIATETAKGAERDPRLKRIKDDHAEPITLSDQTTGILLTSEFFKSSVRRSLQMKLFTKAPDGTVWVVSAYVVGGRDSTLPTPNSALAQWLRAHMLSFTLAGKEIDASAVELAYRKFSHPSE